MEGPWLWPGALQVGHFSVIKWVTFGLSGGSLFRDQWVTFQLSKYSEWRQVVHFWVIKWVTFSLTNIPLGLIEDHRQGLVPLIVPLTLLKHHLNRYPVPDWVPVLSAARVPQQVYLYPYPKELMLRNHV